MKVRNPPPPPAPLSVEISGNLAELIRQGASSSGLTPERYVLSLLWHNVPLKQARPSGLPDCVQLVLNDIQNHNCFFRPQDDFCCSANDEIPF